MFISFFSFPLHFQKIHFQKKLPSFSFLFFFLSALAPDGLGLDALALASKLRRAVRRDREHPARNARDVVVALARSERQRELAALRRRLGRDRDGVGARRLGDALLLLADLGDEVAAGGAGFLFCFGVFFFFWKEREGRKERK